jgi:cellulose synthase operon protein C
MDTRGKKMNRLLGKIALYLFSFLLLMTLALPAFVQEAAKTKQTADQPAKSKKEKAPAKAKATGKDEFVETKKTPKEALVQGLLTDVEKVDQSIQIVKDEIDQTREKRYMPTLLLKLAELYVEKSRLLYYKIKEETREGDKGGVQSPEITDAKELAVETYRKILSDFPDNSENPKVRFFMAHEMRETGNWQGMVEQYERIIADYPDSKYRGEALLLLGDFHFDRRRIPMAEKYYREIITADLDPNITNMARYKLAWCYINDDDYSRALDLFENIAKASKKQKKDREEERLGKSTIVREALIDSVLCFTETKKPAEAIEYYRDLADSEITFAKVMEKLANRYFIKKDLVNSTRLYRELLKISGELEENMEYMKRVLQYSRDASNREQSVEDIDFLIRNLNRYLHSFRVNEEDKRAAYNQFEVYARDIATKLHLKADETKKTEYYDASAKAYKQYLTLFKDSQYAKDIQFNFAEALYSSKKYLEAGEQYETLYKNIKDPKEKSEALYSAVSAYFDAIKDPKTMNKVELIDARQGFIKTAKQYIREFPKSDKTPELRFAIGRTHYDLEEYDESIQAFVKFINDYPNNKMSVDAAQLVLDCYNIKKDYKGMVEQGKMFLANEKIKDKKFRQEVSELVKKTEFVMIQEQTGKGKLAAEQGDYAKDFMQYSQKYRGTELGEKALYNAFQSYRKKNDRKLTFISGAQFIVQYPSSDFLRDVYPTLGTISFEIADYDRACYYFESFHRKFPQEPRATELLGKAAKIRTLLTDTREAIADYQKLLESGRASNPRDIYMDMAQNYERMENWSGAAQSLEQAINLGEDTVEANARLAMAAFKTRNFPRAKQAVDEAAKVAQSKGASRLNQNEFSYLGMIQFVMLEMKYVDFQNVTLVKGAANETKLVERKNKLLGDLEKQLSEISNYRDIKWITAGIFRIGQAYAEFADFVGSTSVPAKLSSAQKKEYRQLLSKKVDILKSKSKETFATALSKAYSLNLFNAWVKSCLKRAYVREDIKIRQNILLNQADRKQIDDLYGELLANPQDGKTLNKIALLYMRNGDHGIAKMILLRASEVQSGDASTYNNLGVAHYYLGDDQDAYTQFAKAVSDSPGYTTAKINLAALSYEYGNMEASQMAVKKLGGLDKLNLNAINVIPSAKYVIGR